MDNKEAQKAITNLELNKYKYDINLDWFIAEELTLQIYK